MLTDALAIYAAVVSTISLAISYFANRSDNPKLSGVATYGKSDLIDTIEVNVYNRGRGAITVESVEIYSKERGDNPESSEVAVSESSRIDGHSGAHWTIPAPPSVGSARVFGNLLSVEVWVNLATGEKLTLKV
jgi:hypothetical protein